MSEQVEAAEGTYSVARVTKVGGVVVNIEVASPAWVEANANDPWFDFIPTPTIDGSNAVIGGTFVKGVFHAKHINKEESA